MPEPEQAAPESAEGTAQAETGSPSSRSVTTDLGVWSRDLFLSLLIAGFIIIFLYQPVKVEGTSMMPWLTDQERIFINKYVYQFDEIQRGDIVVFWYPLDPAKSYIKRVIGLPGETVEESDGEIYINGWKLVEPYILPEYQDRQSYGPLVVPPDEYYVLGDRRSSSSDSRVWGTVPRKHIYGKAVFVYWPMERVGFLP